MSNDLGPGSILRAEVSSLSASLISKRLTRMARSKENLERSLLHISAFNAVAVCPGGMTRKLESRPAIYRRYWCLQFARPGKDDRIPWLKRFNLAKANPRLGHEWRYSGVPPGRKPHGFPDPAINRRATVICPSGTKNHPKKPLSSRHPDLSPYAFFIGN
jgi:hypothetical protein